VGFWSHQLRRPLDPSRSPSSEIPRLFDARFGHFVSAAGVQIATFMRLSVGRSHCLLQKPTAQAWRTAASSSSATDVIEGRIEVIRGGVIIERSALRDGGLHHREAGRISFSYLALFTLWIALRCTLQPREQHHALWNIRSHSMAVEINRKRTKAKERQNRCVQNLHTTTP
jgi:hypothetical protein